MDSKAAKELDYKKTDVVFPDYQLSLVTQQSGGDKVTLVFSGGNTSIFELPAANSYNLARSFLDYDYTLPAVAGSYTVGFYDCLPSIQQLTLQTRSNVKLMDIPNIQQYTKVTFNTDTKFKDFITNDRRNLFCRNNALVNTITPIANVGNSWGCGIRPSGGSATTTASDPTFSDTNYTEPLYVHTTAANNSANSISVRLNLKDIHNTILALDKDLYFNEIIQLVVTWAPYTHLGYSSSTVITPAASTSTAVALIGPTNDAITNLKFYLAVEQNQNIVNNLKAQFAAGGLSTLIDYVYPQMTSFNTGTTSQNLSLKYNSAHGRKLKRIYNAVFNGSTTSPNCRFDHHNNTVGAADLTQPTSVNSPGTVINSYYTMLDNVRLQQFNVNCQVYDDWVIHKSKLEGSVIQNANVYQYNWVHIESFDGMKTCEHDNNISSGLDLSYERKWDFVGTMQTLTYGLVHYTFAVTEKELRVTPQGITCQ